MRERMLNINEVEVSSSPVVYTCYGLGSCIGLFVTDPLKKLSGGAHIPLPGPSSAGNFQGASSMIEELLNTFTKLGSDMNCLRAKITGGSRVYESSPLIGEQNTHAVLQHLIDRRIFIAATDVGGRVSRTVRFNSVTQELRISTSEQKMYCI